MAYKALYRTYRPSTFEEVAGQQHIVKTLKNALATGKIAHAYLFAGPRGTGKTTMAKLLAKALNCEEGIGHQCNMCKNCQAIMEGNHPDVLELDAASNNGVDNIRELIDNVKYGAILGKYKIYIIDEVHMLSAGAFNALLKTLEEPPENVIFILATTEPHKILPTILSRCQRYDFTKVSDKDTKDRIKTILEREGISYNDEAINLIIKLADGGMRDALSILDQVLAYSGNTLKQEDILEIFALESKAEKIALLKSVFAKDVNDVLNRLHNYIQKGSDLKRLTDDLLIMLKDILIYQTSRNQSYLQMLSEDDCRAFVSTVSEKDLLSMIEALMNATKDYRGVTSIAPVFEITLLKLVTISSNSTPSTFKEVAKQEPAKSIEKPSVTPNFGPNTLLDDEEEPEKVSVWVKPAVEAPKFEPKSIEETREEEEIKPAPVAEAPKEEPKVEEPVVEEPQALNVSDTVLQMKNVTVDDHYEINSDDLLKMIVISKKDIKNSLLENWSMIKRYTAHPVLSKAAILLIDAHPLVASDKFVVIEYSMNSLVAKANLVENQLALQNVIETVFKKRLFVYAINRSQSVDIQILYKHKYQVNQLPKANTISFEYEGE